MSGTRYTELIVLEGATSMAPGEVRVVANPVLREPDALFINHLNGDVTLRVDQITTASPWTIRFTNLGSMENETRVGVVYRHSVPK
jgi:hypothetical protein